MADNENSNHPHDPEEKQSLNHSGMDDTATDDLDAPEFNDSTAKFLNGGKNGGEVTVPIYSNGDSSSEDSFSGLGKEELMQYANDPFWVRIRIILFAAFWIGWIIMLVAAIIIIVMAPRCPERPSLKWYETDVVYKIDPKSFKDTAADKETAGSGIGDIAGIQNEMSYIQSLGVNAIWLSSLFKSGNKYDGNTVVDHTQINEDLGSMAQFDALRKATKKKGMKIVVDFIPNHTGKKHEWFMKSQQRDEDFTNFYIWADGPNTTAPNNWRAADGSLSSWAYDNVRKQWYYYSYLPEYPDLNLDNPEVLGKLDGILRFWLDKGVDGFNIVGLERLIELNDTSKAETSTGEFTNNQPGNLELVKRWRSIIDSYSDKPGRERALFGHVTASDNSTSAYHKAGIHIVSSNALIDLDITPTCDSACLERDVKDAAMDSSYWTGLMVGNEETSRFGSRVSEADLQRVYQVFLLLLPGTPLVYYGDEIAMKNGNVPSIDTKDLAVKSGLASRDNYRTPMLWNNDANAGFAVEGISPWLPVNDDYKKDNVEFNSAHLNGFSILESFKSLVKLRGMESFQWGGVDVNVDGDIMYFTRKAEGFPGYLVAINRGDIASYSFASIGDVMTLVYNSANTNDINKQFSMKNRHLAFTKGQIYVFQYE